MYRILAISVLTLVGTTGILPAADLNQRLVEDRITSQATGFWIYNDLSAGMAEAKRTNKPLLVHIRCIP